MKIEEAVAIIDSMVHTAPQREAAMMIGAEIGSGMVAKDQLTRIVRLVAPGINREVAWTEVLGLVELACGVAPGLARRVDALERLLHPPVAGEKWRHDNGTVVDIVWVSDGMVGFGSGQLTESVEVFCDWHRRA